MTKVALLTAVRDALRSGIAETGTRAWCTVQDAQGDQFIPVTAQPPFLTVADGGWELAPLASEMANVVARVRIRAHVQNFRDFEAPVIGHTVPGTPPVTASGAAGLQDAIADLLQDNALGIAGMESALVESLPAVGSVQDDKDFFAIVGDVVMRYTFERSDA